MKGEDRRDPNMILKTAQILNGAAASPAHSVLSLQSSRRALGWAWNHAEYTSLEPGDEATDTNLSIRLTDLEAGEYDLEFWDTVYGRVIATARLSVADGALTAPIPPFTRDVAFKLKPH